MRAGFLALVVGAGCATHISTTRIQAPMIEVPPGTRVMLSSVVRAEGVLEHAPMNKEDSVGPTIRVLREALGRADLVLEDGRAHGWSPRIGPESGEGKLPERAEGASLGYHDLQSFAVAWPAEDPPEFDEPLVLAVLILGWSFRSERVDPIIVDQATRVVDEVYERPAMQESSRIDIVYALCTRDGRQVEVRRVTTDLKPSGRWATAVTYVPDRPRWWDRERMVGEALGLADEDLEDTFWQALRGNADAFAFPFQASEVEFRPRLDDSDPALRPGIALLKQGKIDEAFASWESVARSQRSLAGASYNLGIVMEIRGRDEEAVVFFRQALEARPGTGFYLRELKDVESRLRSRVRPRL